MLLKEQFEHMQELVTEIKDMLKSHIQDLKNNYVTRQEFQLTIKPIKAIVYGMVGILLSGIAFAIVNVVLK